MSEIVRVQEISSKSEHLKIASKNCLNQITIISNVSSSDRSFQSNGSFKDFVSVLLARRDSYRIRRFSLKLRSMDFDSVTYNLVNDCVRNVLNRRVLDLELDVNVNEGYALPSEVFTCKKVAKLRLGSGFVIENIPKNALLPALKTLLLDKVRFNDTNGDCAFTRLISASPVLEELVIYRNDSEDWKWSRIVVSQILKRLTFRGGGWRDHSGCSFEPISFDTPSLEYFEYFDILRDEYPVVNLNSLVEAKIELFFFLGGDHYDARNLVKALKNVRILSVGAVDTMHVFNTFKKKVPVFENLNHLSISTELASVCWDAVPILLEKSPNLKTLTVEALHYNTQDRGDVSSVCKCLDGYYFLSSCHIKVLKITKFKGDIGEMVQIKHVLEKLPRLELLELHSQASRNDLKLMIMMRLLMLPRASSKCKVKVKFS
ncbi:PREDICTED: F-box protein At3g62430-like [Camelina sativa]|uniref:F-box protein At3g62430-like n=1 Tax=Camelina sativa TaxID=90675 RepID=A0ABM0SL29_CAMSA|nr:PREDICTED: F-box protein At3g62430-like [Camelina sativa]